jgi:hypothetical protein
VKKKSIDILSSIESLKGKVLLDPSTIKGGTMDNCHPLPPTNGVMLDENGNFIPIPN